MHRHYGMPLETVGHAHSGADDPTDGKGGPHTHAREGLGAVVTLPQLFSEHERTRLKGMRLERIVSDWWNVNGNPGRIFSADMGDGNSIGVQVTPTRGTFPGEQHTAGRWLADFLLEHTPDHAFLDALIKRLTEACRTCFGQGYLNGDPFTGPTCHTCKGSGDAPKAEAVAVNG